MTTMPLSFWGSFAAIVLAACSSKDSLLTIHDGGETGGSGIGGLGAGGAGGGGTIGAGGATGVGAGGILGSGGGARNGGSTGTTGVGGSLGGGGTIIGQGGASTPGTGGIGIGGVDAGGVGAGGIGTGGAKTGGVGSGGVGTGGGGMGGSPTGGAPGAGGSQATGGAGGAAPTGGNGGTGTGGMQGTGGATGQTCGGAAATKCPSGQFCELPNCGTAFNATGACTPMGGTCSPTVAKVCGCDGKTYNNDCERLNAGVSKVSNGVCTGCSANYLVWQGPAPSGGPTVSVCAGGWAYTWERTSRWPSPEQPPSDVPVSLNLTADQTTDLFSRLASTDISSLPHATSKTADCYPYLYFRLCSGCAAKIISYNVAAQLAPEMQSVWQWFDQVLGSPTAVTNPRNYCNY